MDPDEIFKRFFGGPFPGFNDGHGGVNERRGQDVFDDMQRQMQQQMEEMDRQMREVFTIFHVPQEPSGVFALPEAQEGDESCCECNPRDHMLKDGREDQSVVPPMPESQQPKAPLPGQGFGFLFDMLDQFTRLPKMNRALPEEKIDRDLDSKSPSGAEIADMMKKDKEEPLTQIVPANPSNPERMPMRPFSFSGSSVSIRTVIGADGRVEEKRTVRDSSGREETTITRKMGDSEHTVTTIKDGSGQEEKHEIYNNIDQGKEDNFNRHWSERKTLPEPDTPHNGPLRGGMLSDENRGIFRKFFGF